MDTSSRGNHRDRKAARRSTPRESDRSPSPSDLADHAVAAAEEIVCDAWVQMLLEHRDRAQLAMEAASMRCDDARRTLAAALHERAPARIASAHADLEEALTTARLTSHACEQAREGLALQLDLLAWKAIERRVDACVARRTGSARLADPAKVLLRPPVPVLMRLFGRVMAWFLYATARLVGVVRPS